MPALPGLDKRAPHGQRSTATQHETAADSDEEHKRKELLKATTEEPGNYRAVLLSIQKLCSLPKAPNDEVASVVDKILEKLQPLTSHRASSCRGWPA